MIWNSIAIDAGDEQRGSTAKKKISLRSKPFIKLGYSSSSLSRTENVITELELRNSVHHEKKTIRCLRERSIWIDLAEPILRVLNAENTLLLGIWQRMKTSREKDIAQRE